MLQGQSPAELLMGRQPRTRIPALRFSESSRKDEFRARDAEVKARQKRNFDARHRARELPRLREGQEVWIKTPKTTEAVVSRSIPVTTSSGHNSRRNRSQLKLRQASATIHPPSVPKDSCTIHPHQEQMPLIPEPEPSSTEIVTEKETAQTTRSGRVVKPPRVMDL